MENSEEIRTVPPSKLYDIVLQPMERGTVVMEWVKCGKPNCKCATKGERHGPYPYHYARTVVNGKVKLKKWYVHFSEAPRLSASLKEARERRRQANADLHNAALVLRELSESGGTLPIDRIAYLNSLFYARNTGTE